MRFPNTICRKYFEFNQIPDNVYNRNERLRSDSLSWDKNFVKTLRELCLQTIADNWEKYPIYEELELEEDKSILIDLLKPELPLELIIPKLHNDIYWKKAYKTRWPDSPPRIKFVPKIKDVNNIMRGNIVQAHSSGSISVVISSRSSSQRSPSIVTRNSSSSDEGGMKKYTERDLAEKSWKVNFLERYLEEELEKMNPESFNPEYIKELTDLLGPYILGLQLQQLKASSDESKFDHISLHSLLARLPNLLEFSVCFTEENVDENFSWHVRKVSDTDCELLGNGVAKSKLEILRILRSDIDCSKIKIILGCISAHKTLRVLDLSHCKIQNEGAKTLAEMFEETPSLETVILTNNKIGPSGTEAIANYLGSSECRLLAINLKLNPIKVEGGKHISTALSNEASSLQLLSLAACGLTHENMDFGEVLALNKSLKKLDLSNNRVGEEFGDNFLKGLQQNSSLIQADLRMCGISPRTLQNIETLLKDNLTGKQTVLVKVKQFGLGEEQKKP